MTPRPVRRRPGLLHAALMLLCGVAQQGFAAVGGPPASCQRPSILPAACVDGAGRAVTGSFFSLNGGAWQAHGFAAPLSVLAGQRLAIAVCNHNNHSLGRGHWPASKSLIPTLVGSIGAQATLAVHVEGSANLQLNDRFTLGENTLGADGTLGEASSRVESALIASLVVGPIGEGARIDMRIRDSGNVVMATPQSHLHLGGGRLSEGLIRSVDAAPATAQGACIDVQMERVNRVVGGQGSLTIGSGQLTSAIVAHGLQNSSVTVRERDVANVAVGQARLYKGGLMAETVDAGALLGNRLSLLLDNVGNVRAQSLEIDDAVLIDEVVDAEELRDSLVELALADAGNVTLAGALRISDGGLIDEAVDVENVTGSRIDVRFLRSATVIASSVEIVEGDLIDEAIDGETFQGSELAVQFAQSARIVAGLVTLREGELIDEMLDGVRFADSQIHLQLADSGSVAGQRLELAHGELIDEMLDAEDDITRSRLLIGVTGSGNARVDALTLFAGELADEIIDAQHSTDLIAQVEVGDSFNVAGHSALSSQQVSLVRSTLMDEVTDIGARLDRFDGKFGIRNAANIAASSISLDASRLMEAVVQAGTITHSAIALTVHQSANAIFSTGLALTGDGVLMAPPVAAGALDAASRLSQTVAASGQRVQLQP